MFMARSVLIVTTALSLLLTACQKPANDTTAVAASSAAVASNVTTQSNTASAQSTTAPNLDAQTQAYKTWVEHEVDELLSGTERFVAALDAGDLATAKQLYPQVRMHYERVEPIAESFGDLDPRIDNREADLQAGEAWTGFHAIEKILWTKNTTNGTHELGQKLLADIKELRAKVPTAEVTGELMVQGSVDLLNEVSTSKITGEEEIFSGTDLYDFKANIEGAEKIFNILTPVIQAKDPALVQDLTAKFNAVDTLLARHQIGSHDYQPYKQLTPDETKALAEAVNKLGEPLAQMGIVLQ